MRHTSLLVHALLIFLLGCLTCGCMFSDSRVLTSRSKQAIYPASVIFTPDDKAIVFGTIDRSNRFSLIKRDLASNVDEILVKDRYYIGGPAMSDKGGLIAYESERTGAAKIWLFDVETKMDQQLTQGKHQDIRPIFSHDAADVYFSRRLSNNPDSLMSDEIFVIDVKSGEETQLTSDKIANYPIRVSDDGRSLYFQKVDTSLHVNLWKMDLSTREERQLFSEQFRGSLADVYPSTELAAFIADISGQFEYDIWLANLTGETKRQLTRLKGYVSEARFNSDGSRIVFVSEPARSAKGRGEIMIANVKDSSLTRVGANARRGG